MPLCSPVSWVLHLLSLSLSLSLKAVVWLYIFPRSPLEKYPSGVHDTSRSEVTGNDTQQLGDETTADDEDESDYKLYEFLAPAV